MGLLDQFRAYVDANTPRSTRPAVNPAHVIDQGLLGGRIGQIPQRAQEMYQGLLNAPGELAQLASPQSAKAVQEAYQPTVSSLITNPPNPLDKEKWLSAGLELSGMAPVMGMVGMTKSLGPALSKADDAAGGLLENGPVVGWHGSNDTIDAIDLSKKGANFPGYSLGFHVAGTPEEAAKYGANLHQVELNAKNPLIVRGDQASKTVDMDRAQIIKDLFDAKKSGKPYDAIYSYGSDGSFNGVALDAEIAKILGVKPSK